FDGGNNGDVGLNATLDTLVAQAEAGNCDLVAKGRVNGQDRGWLYVGGGMWKSDKLADAQITRATLIATAELGTELTITGVPPGSGQRMGVDRDRDGYFDGDELDAHSDPGNPASTPLNGGVGAGARPVEGLRRVGPNPARGRVEVEYALAKSGVVELAVYDVLGREVRSLERGVKAAGVGYASWDGRDSRGGRAGAGVYFVR